MCDYVPVLPFKDYKWFFATKAPTEALGDPAVLLGLVSRLNKIADGKVRYSGEEFARVMRDLDRDIKTTVDLSRRVHDRNLMRNSGQYWKTFGLIPATPDHSGIIKLTDLAKSIANGDVSQVDFAASMIISMKLPNTVNYTAEQVRSWEDHDLSIHPFKVILQIVRDLNEREQGWLTNNELYYVVVPMAGDKQKHERIAEYVLKYRSNPHIADNWPYSTQRSNDIRFTGEYLRFLSNFGYLQKEEDRSNKIHDRDSCRYLYVKDIDYQIQELLNGTWSENSADLLKMIRKSDISSSVTLSSTMRRNSRPRQQQFRHDLLEAVPRCPITGVTIPEVLQAAHIKPHAFGGPEQMDNGLPLRADIHCLFDAGLLSLEPIGGARWCHIELRSDQVKNDYHELIGKAFELPEITNMEYVRWRYENYLLGA